MRVPHNRPPVTGKEIEYISDVLNRRHFAGDGYYTHLCQTWLTEKIGGVATRLTHSGTAALEMAAVLSEVGPGDEAIMPSFTFASTANAFVLRGAIPVFVDIRPDTLNIDHDRIEEAITPRTKAIVVVHYGGVCAEMNTIQAVADRYGLIVIEDAAQALLSTYCGGPAGSLSALSCFSFHETKNVVSGEGGALVVNQARFVDRADVIREKGTNRVAFRNRMVDKYTWIDIGSSYLPAEIVAAALWAQLEAAEKLTAARLTIWDRYHQALLPFAKSERIRRPTVPQHCGGNGHQYHLLLRDRADRDAMITQLGADGILAPFHYIPLHSSPAGQRYGRGHGDLSRTMSISERLLRLPLYVGLEDQQDFVIERVTSYLRK